MPRLQSLRSRSALKSAAGAAIALALLLTPTVQAHELGTTPGPSLAFVFASRPYIMEVRGSGWHPFARIVFSMHVDGLARGQEIRATQAGSFQLGVTGATDCAIIGFHATAVGGRSVSISMPPKTCAGALSRRNTDLRLHLIQGKSAMGAITRIEGIGPAQIEMQRGNRILISETGTPPGFLPRPDPLHFSLLSQQDFPSSTACAGLVCGSRRLWTYVAIARGDGFIGMEPACRQTHPACMIAERAIRVSIT